LRRGKIRLIDDNSSAYVSSVSAASITGNMIFFPKIGPGFGEIHVQDTQIPDEKVRAVPLGAS
jgi:hypothetical protein